MPRRNRRIQKALQQAQRRFKKQKQLNLLAKNGCHDFTVVMDNLKPAFNVAKIFRSADAFGAFEVHLVGIDYFDPAPAKGSFKHVPTRFHDGFRECHQALQSSGYTIFMLDAEAPRTLEQTVFPSKSAFVFGHEEYGFSFDAADFPDLVPVAIPQFGRVKCLNVSVAASIVMYEYARQHSTTEP